MFQDPDKTHFDIWLSILEEEQAFVRLFGLEAVDEVGPKLMAVLGAEAVCLFEEAFCEASGCPPEQLDDFLREKWNLHHASRVARLEEIPDPFPVLLIRQKDPFYSLEIWSPKDAGDALVVAHSTRELSNEDMERLLAIVGGADKASLCQDSEFCAQFLCPPSEMENWLSDFWIEYDISTVVAGSKMVGPNPIILVKQFEEFFTARLFSPSEALGCEGNEGDREAAEISELNRLYVKSEASDEELP